MVHSRPTSSRLRVGQVSLYLHHGALWIYYRKDGKPVRRKISDALPDGEQLAAQVNAHLVEANAQPATVVNAPAPVTVHAQPVTGAPAQAPFTPISVSDLRELFLDYHEHVLHSSVGTVRRYRAATRHLIEFVEQQRTPPQAHEFSPSAFAAYLRKIEVTPNGHHKARKRRLRDKGIQFILETCRSMFNFAVKRRHLPPYVGNPFSELPLDRLRIKDAKPIFVFTADTELAFFRAVSAWGFPIHFTLAKTGLRVGELVHLLIEEVDLDAGWLHVRNKTELGWRAKTGNERSVPLLPEVVTVLRWVIGKRKGGPVFLRERLVGRMPALVGDRRELERNCRARQQAARVDDQPLSQSEAHRIAQGVWRDAGAVKADMIRTSFVRIMKGIGHSEATCPKSWRHSFATLLQDANVDPLIRQQTLGHRPTNDGGLGMTANYTHTRGETQREQIERALRLWPESLRYALERIGHSNLASSAASVP
jgi:integrase